MIMNEFLSYILDRCKLFMKCVWDRITSFISNHYIVVFLLVIYICFHGFWEKLADEFIVKNFLSTLNTGNIIIDILFFAAFLYCIVNCVILISKEDNQAKRTNLFYDTIFFVFWVYYTCFSKRYTFTCLYLLDNICYLDIIPVYYCCKQFPYLWDKTTNLCLGDHEISFSRLGFSRDIPIVNESEDYLERDAIAASEIEKIIETETINDSFSYGLDASWGSGKTSFMNLMKDHLYKDFSNSCIIMDFNPWLFSCEKNLVALFFDELSKHLKPYDDTLADSIIDYSKALSSIASTSSELRFISDVFDISHQSSTLQDKVSIIRNAILSIGKKIVVFVDDIDRLDSNELMEMLKLIRNISDFPKMYFVVAYDKSYLVNILKDKMAHKELDFTEKIFQAEFHLPHCTIENLKDTLYYALNDHIDNEFDRTVIHGCIFNEKKTILSIGAITSLRDIKRLANSFYSSYSQLKGEVNARDLLLLEVLKVKYPMVYTLLEEKRNEYLIKDNSNGKYWFLDSIVATVPDTKEYVIEQYLTSHITQLSINKDDCIIIIKILELLFPDANNRDDHHEKSINLIDHTNRYFNLSINDIPKRRFEDIFKKNIEEVEPRFKQWFDKWPRSLTLRMGEYHPKTRTELTNIIKLFIHLVSEDTTSYFSSQAITRLLTGFSSFSSDKQIVSDVFKENGFSPNLSRYLLDISKNSFGPKKGSIITKEEAESIRYTYFSNCLQDPSCETWMVIDSFRSTVNYMHIGLDKKRVYYRDSDIMILRGYVENHLIDSIPFLFNNPKEMIAAEQNNKSDSSDNEYSLNELPLLLWKNWNSFFTVVSNVEDSLHKIEFLDYYEAYKNNNYKPTTFKFKHISFSVLDKINQYIDGNVAIMKTVKIFLTSPTELSNDRQALALFVDRFNNHYATTRGYALELLSPEYLEIASGVSFQNEYNREIRRCDLYLALFNTKVGEYARQEINLALEESYKRGLPLLFYFRDLKGKEKPKEIEEIQFKIQGISWRTYDTKDKLLLDFALWLDKYLFDGKNEIIARSDDAVLGDVNVTKISQLSFVANNTQYQQLGQELQKLSQEIEMTRKQVDNNPNDEKEKEKYQKTLNKHNEILAEWTRYQQSLLDIAKLIVDINEETKTGVLKQAIDAFESGDIVGTNVILREIAIDEKDFLERLNQDHNLVHQNIDALRLQAKTELADVDTPIEERIARIAEIFVKADDWANRSGYDKEQYAELLFEYAQFSKKYGHYNVAMQIYLHQITLSEELYGIDDTHTLKSYNEIGELYQYLGDFTNAFEYYNKVIKIAEHDIESNNHDLVVSFCNIGEVNHQMGSFEKALEYYFKALDICRMFQDKEHPDTATLYNHIGVVYCDLGDYIKSLDYYFKALEISEKIQGKQHPDTAPLYNSIGGVYVKMGDYANA